MNEEQQDLVVPKLTVDPELPDALSRLIRATNPEILSKADTPKEESAWWGLLAPARKETALVGAAWITIVANAPSLSVPLAAGAGGVFLLWSGGSVLYRKARQSELRRVLDARQHYVLPEDLEDDARKLLARAHNAIRSVSRSAMHREDLIDRLRNERLLPAQEWDIAAALRDYSRLVRQEPKKPTSEKITDLLAERRRRLKLSRNGITCRVLALEVYARMVAEADRQYAELQQVQQLADGDEEVRELLARTARDALAVAEIESMTSQAVAVAEAFSAALESAREAAVIALPLAAQTA
ncbi:hypothetical protein AB0H73_09510 [Streptomyces olivoreticuli]